MMDTKVHFPTFQSIHRIGTKKHGDDETYTEENNNEVLPLPSPLLKQRPMTLSNSTNTIINNTIPKLSSKHRINSNKSGSVSITVDLPTIRPSGGIYSPVLNKQPLSRVNTMFPEEDGETESDSNSEDEGIEDTGEEEEDGGDDDDDDDKVSKVDDKGEFFLNETNDLLNHRIKLIDDLHLNTGQTSDQVVMTQEEREDSRSNDLESTVSDISDFNKSSKNLLFKRIKREETENNETNILKIHKISLKHYTKILNRAKHVGSFLSTYYDYIEEYEKIHYFDKDTGGAKYANVDGVWNPLQIMRNRRVRMHKGEKLKKFTMHGQKVGVNNEGNGSGNEGLGILIDNDIIVNNDWKKVKVASRVFSKYSKPRLIWQIGLYEIIGDLIWRENKWHELRDPNGKRWFPLHNGVKEIQNLHELLFDDEKREVKKEIKRKEDGKDEGRKKEENLATVARFKHYKKKSKPEIPIIEIEEKEREDMGNSKKNDSFGAYGDEMIRDIKYFDAIDEVLELMRMNRITDGDIEGMKFAMIMKEQMINKELVDGGRKLRDKIMEIENLENESVAKYTHFLKLLQDSDEKIEEQRSWISKKADNIEELLGYCDRTNGEINTSITLKLRNLLERAENMEERCGCGEDKYFSLCIYKLIEGAIVGLLWVVWIIVEAWIWGRWGVLRIVDGFRWFI